MSSWTCCCLSTRNCGWLGSGIDATKYPIVVHWYNSAAQYWITAAASTSDFPSPAMKPGTYTMVLYQHELLVATSSVTVTAGTKVTKNIASTWTIGSSALIDFPMAVFKDVNTPLTITFTLTAAQVAAAANLRLGTTLAFAGGRHSVVLNSKAFPTPAAPVAIDSRGVTRGAYRGRGEVYSFAVAAGDLFTGTNTITINVASRSSGADFLEPSFIFDAVDLFR